MNLREELERARERKQKAQQAYAEAARELDSASSLVEGLEAAVRAEEEWCSLFRATLRGLRQKLVVGPRSELPDDWSDFRARIVAYIDERLRCGRSDPEPAAEVGGGGVGGLRHD